MGDMEPDALVRGFLEAIPDACYALDEDGRLLWWNDTFAERAGYDDTTLAGFDIFELVAPDQRTVARDAFEHSGEFPSDVTLTFDLFTADDERIPHEFNGEVVEVTDEKVVVAIGRDVSSRREREEALGRQRDELDRLNRISETVYGVIRAVTDAATRERIEEVTCERLADCELYQAVWIGRNDGSDGVEPRTGVGSPDGFLEAVREVNELDWCRPASIAIETGEPQVRQQVSESDLPAGVREAAERLGLESGISVPIDHDERVEGVLTVYSSRPDGFNEREGEALRRLGSVIGFAIHAARTERLIVSETATELTFRSTAPAGLLAAVSARADGPCYREWSAPTKSGDYRHYVTVHGLDPETVVELLEERSNVESASHVGSGGDEGVYEVIMTDSLVRRLLEVGASTTNVVAEDGESTVVAEIPGGVDTRPIVETAEEMYDTELVSKRTLDRSVRTADEFHDPVAGQLTERQQAALKHAYFNGYYSWPRDATAEEIADAMDVSSPTLHYHLRRAEQALVEAYLQYLG